MRFTLVSFRIMYIILLLRLYRHFKALLYGVQIDIIKSLMKPSAWFQRKPNNWSIWMFSVFILTLHQNPSQRRHVLSRCFRTGCIKNRNNLLHLALRSWPGICVKKAITSLFFVFCTDLLVCYPFTFGLVLFAYHLCQCNLNWKKENMHCVSIEGTVS